MQCDILMNRRMFFFSLDDPLAFFSAAKRHSWGELTKLVNPFILEGINQFG